MSRIPITVCFVLVLMLSHTVCRSQQHTYTLDQTIPVEVNGQTISLPWTGGLNSAQINSMDLDGDGKDDLVVFDRTANKLFPFLSDGKKYTYAPDYETFFPASINEWVLFRDFNCDGKKDLFTSDPGGIAVFVNTTSPGNSISWRSFNPGHPLLTHWYSESINIQMNATDIPAIDDIDEDGDLDIIVAQFAGYGSLQFHKNMSIERTGKCDSLQLNWITSMWGNFEECNCGRYAFGGINCDQLPGGRDLHDAGKSMLTLDLNNDGLHDLIFSEETCTSLYLLANEGRRDSADISTFSIYPSANPCTLLFPAAFYEDVDFDGAKDLVVSTNLSARVTTDIDLSNSIWLYKNVGTTDVPQFNFQKQNLFQGQMIDAGSYSSPAFADFDNDGDLDLFISFWAIPDSVASIYQYENTGSFSEPSYKFITNDYLNFSQLGFYNIKIQFEDFDKDGNADLLFTATDKETAVTQLYLLKNKGVNHFDFSGQSPQALRFTIDQLENVFVYDVNNDKLDDVLCGRSDGSLQYYKNTGAVFVPNDLNYLGLKSDITRFCMSPTVNDLNHDGKPDLILGNRGVIVVYNDFQSNPNPVADTLQIDNNLTSSSTPRILSSFIDRTTADVFATGNPVIASGTITGGIVILKPTNTTANGNENSVSFWPNPVNPNAPFFVRVTQASTVQLFNVLGEKLNEPISIPSRETLQITQTLSPGLYLAKISWSGKSQTIKIVVR